MTRVLAGGQGRGRAVTMGGRGLGEKPPFPDMSNLGVSDGGDEHSYLIATDQETVVDEIKHTLKQQVIDLTAKVEEMERQVIEVNRIRASLRRTKSLNLKSVSNPKDRIKEKSGLGNKKQQLQSEGAHREPVRMKRMAELMRQLGTVLKQITQHGWAWPFLAPVDVERLHLVDYFDIIKKPMDLGTIRKKMDAKDGTGYKHIQEICDDVRLVFSNAMVYNEEGSDVYVMARCLSEKFEEKWKVVLEPKLLEEENRRQLEDKEATAKEAAALHAAEEAATEKMADDVSRQLEDLDKELEDLKQKAAPRCRIMTIEEKRQLGHSLGRLPADNLQRVIQIIAQKNPDFNPAADEVEVDIDAQEPATLWRLHRYVQSVTNLKARTLAQVSPISTRREVLAVPEKLGAKRSRKVPSP